MENKKQDSIKEITNGLHSLFIIPKKEKFEKIEDCGLYNKIEKHNLYRLYIQEFLGGKFDIKEQYKINNIFNELQESKSEQDSLEVRISSRGGYIDELSRFENIINTKFRGRTTTILDNNGLSCGAMLFLMGDIRLIHKNSYIMFHYYSGGVYGKGGEIKDQAKFDEMYYEEYFKKAMKPYFTKKEIEELLIGKDYWFNSEEMLQRGIATEII